MFDKNFLSFLLYRFATEFQELTFYKRCDIIILHFHFGIKIQADSFIIFPKECKGNFDGSGQSAYQSFAGRKYKKASIGKEYKKQGHGNTITITWYRDFNRDL